MVQRGAPVRTQTSQAITRESTKACGEEGYTLLELLVVIAIASLIVAATPTVYAALVPQFQVREFANAIADKAKEARRLAKTDGAIHWIEVVNGANTLIVDGEPFEGPDAVVIAFQAEQSWKQTAQNRIEFYPNGATSGGVISLEAGNIESTVSIDWASGKIKVQQ